MEMALGFGMMPSEFWRCTIKEVAIFISARNDTQFTLLQYDFAILQTNLGNMFAKKKDYVTFAKFFGLKDTETKQVKKQEKEAWERHEKWAKKVGNIIQIGDDGKAKRLINKDGDKQRAVRKGDEKNEEKR